MLWYYTCLAAMKTYVFEDIRHRFSTKTVIRCRLIIGIVNVKCVYVVGCCAHIADILCYLGCQKHVVEYNNVVIKKTEGIRHAEGIRLSRRYILEVYTIVFLKNRGYKSFLKKIQKWYGVYFRIPSYISLVEEKLHIAD